MASVWPGASIFWILTIALAGCIIHATSYAIIGAAVPLAGADYVLSS